MYYYLLVSDASGCTVSVIREDKLIAMASGCSTVPGALKRMNEDKVCIVYVAGEEADLLEEVEYQGGNVAEVEYLIEQSRRLFKRSRR